MNSPDYNLWVETVCNSQNKNVPQIRMLLKSISLILRTFKLCTLQDYMQLGIKIYSKFTINEQQFGSKNIHRTGGRQ